MRMVPGVSTWSVVPGTPDGVSTLGFVGSFGLSTDGLNVAFSADGTVTQAYEVFTVSLVSGGPATRVSSGTLTAGLRPDFVRSLRYDPSDANLFFGANFVSGGTTTFEPFAIPLPSGTERRLATFVGGGLVDEFTWSPTGALALVADARTDTLNELFLAPGGNTAAPLTPLVTPVTGGSVFDATWTP